MNHTLSPSALTRRQRIVCLRLITMHHHKQIADELGVCTRTVENEVSRVARLLESDGRGVLVWAAVNRSELLRMEELYERWRNSGKPVSQPAESEVTY